jgi:uncharacterized membrane protein YsdA (DUF1294 family)
LIYYILISYLVIMNAVGFFSMGQDKRRAVAHGRRTPEKTLILIALLGGSFGSILGMKVYHHKTKHMKFTLGIPAILFLQILIATAAIVYL